ncbi:hypothetical protein BDC45DRAFT_73612 [Circinella umbellata]|nr:hypothetical protein BDC45DRAFT_73612 [Circinella umbellata]
MQLDNMDSNIILQQMDLIQAQLVRRIDFVAHCPYEIICNIIDRVGQNTATECLKVCRTWRQTFLSYPHVWRTIYIGPDERKKTLFDQKEILKLPYSITKYIETLYVSSSTYPACSQMLMSLTKYSFDNLKTLAISDERYWCLTLYINTYYFKTIIIKTHGTRRLGIYFIWLYLISVKL